MKDQNAETYEFLKQDPFSTVSESKEICPECKHRMFEQKVDGQWIARCVNCEINFHVE